MITKDNFQETPMGLLAMVITARMADKKCDMKHFPDIMDKTMGEIDYLITVKNGIDKGKSSNVSKTVADTRSNERNAQ